MFKQKSKQKPSYEKSCVVYTTPSNRTLEHVWACCLCQLSKRGHSLKRPAASSLIHDNPISDGFLQHAHVFDLALTPTGEGRRQNSVQNLTSNFTVQHKPWRSQPLLLQSAQTQTQLKVVKKSVNRQDTLNTRGCGITHTGVDLLIQVHHIILNNGNTNNLVSLKAKKGKILCFSNYPD